MLLKQQSSILLKNIPILTPNYIPKSTTNTLKIAKQEYAHAPTSIIYQHSVLCLKERSFILDLNNIWSLV
jgi:hypothetical protein